MAFPAVQTADTKNGVQTSNAITWTLTYPTNLASGDLILALLSNDGANSANTWPGGWINLNLGTGANDLNWAKKLSDGTETGNFSVTLTGSEQGAWRVFRITGWEGTIGTDFGNAGTDGAVLAASTITGSPSAAPNPPSLDPANWGVEDTLWIAACSVDTSRTISVWPLADLQTSDVSGGAGGATLGVCMTNSAVASLDPGTFTISASDDWAAITIAVRPAAAAAFIEAPSIKEMQAVNRAATY